jgi:DNA-binding NarL/FixJ family response regulator
LLEGDLAATEVASSEGARLSREIGDLYYLERMLMNLGLVALATGDLRGSSARREAEVARLIAEGLSNREIAARLFISERTVTTHVGNMLNKLGFDSRVQIASWMGTSGL